jgi:hypothetical protein
MRSVIVLGSVLLSVGGLSGCCGGSKGGEAVSEKPTAAPAANVAKTKTAAAVATVATPAGPALTAAPGAGAAAPDVPSGRSAPPSVAEWSAASTVNTVGANAQAKDCTMKLVREWLKVNCTGNIKGTSNMEGFGKEGFDYFQSVRPPAVADFVVRVTKGKSMKVRILRTNAAGASLFVNWPGNLDKPSIMALQIFNG